MTASTGEIVLIRHGPTDRPGRLCGRTDVGLAADVVFPTAIGLGAMDRVLISPAKRARQTAAGLFPGVALQEDPRFWEQDFGAWENVPYGDLPDVGVLSRSDLADLAGPGGESFRDLVARVRPALRAAAPASGAIAIVAHAGVVRAGLAIALESDAHAMAFEIDHFSVTRLRCLVGGGFSVISVNETLPMAGESG